MNQDWRVHELEWLRWDIHNFWFDAISANYPDTYIVVILYRACRVAGCALRGEIEDEALQDNIDNLAANTDNFLFLHGVDSE